MDLEWFCNSGGNGNWFASVTIRTGAFEWNSIIPQLDGFVQSCQFIYVHVLTTVQRSSMKLRKQSWNGQKIGCKTVNDLVLCTYHVIELLPGIVWNCVELGEICTELCRLPDSLEFEWWGIELECGLEVSQDLHINVWIWFHSRPSALLPVMWCSSVSQPVPTINLLASHFLNL